MVQTMSMSMQTSLSLSFSLSLSLSLSLIHFLSLSFNLAFSFILRAAGGSRYKLKCVLISILEMYANVIIFYNLIHNLLIQTYIYRKLVMKTIVDLI